MAKTAPPITIELAGWATILISVFLLVTSILSQVYLWEVIIWLFAIVTWSRVGLLYAKLYYSERYKNIR